MTKEPFWVKKLLAVERECEGKRDHGSWAEIIAVADCDVSIKDYAKVAGSCLRDGTLGSNIWASL
jgi:hypothetical protein